MFLVIPDVHGREFWRVPCNDIDKYEHIVFLGDYVDPYGFERHRTSMEVLQNFTDIVALARQNPGKVTLLLGNHDLHYLGDYGTASRYNDWMEPHMREIILDTDRDLFSVAYRHGDTLFTHAGCLEAWVEEANGKFPGLNLEMTVDSLNSLIGTDDGCRALTMVGQCRWGMDKNGSCMWADVSEHLKATSPLKQVFGHTLQARENPKDYRKIDYLNEVAKPENNILMLDCARAFELDPDNPFDYTRLPNPEIDN